jgi:hypothetical protein
LLVFIFSNNPSKWRVLFSGIWCHAVWWTSTGLCSITSQKIVLFVVTALRISLNSSPNYLWQCDKNVFEGFCLLGYNAYNLLKVNHNISWLSTDYMVLYPKR